MRWLAIVVLITLLVSLGIAATGITYRVVAATDPSTSGTYLAAGTFNGAPCFSNAQWSIWWKPDWVPGVYLVSPAVGDVSRYWVALRAGSSNVVCGLYTNDMVATQGSLVVTNAP